MSLVTRSSVAPTRRVMVSRSIDGDREFAGFADGASVNVPIFVCFNCMYIHCGFGSCPPGLPADSFADCFYRVQDIPGNPLESNGLPGTKCVALRRTQCTNVNTRYPSSTAYPHIIFALQVGSNFNFEPRLSSVRRLGEGHCQRGC